MGRTVGLILKPEPIKEPSKFDGMDVEQLKVYAGENGIDIGNANSVNGIIKKITEAEKKA
jgi:hypothetical protein